MPLSLTAIIIHIIYIKVFNFPHSKLTQHSSLGSSLANWSILSLVSLMPLKMLILRHQNWDSSSLAPEEAELPRKSRSEDIRKSSHLQIREQPFLPGKKKMCCSTTVAQPSWPTAPLFEDGQAGKHTYLPKNVRMARRGQGMTQLSLLAQNWPSCLPNISDAEECSKSPTTSLSKRILTLPAYQADIRPRD